MTEEKLLTALRDAFDGAVDMGEYRLYGGCIEAVERLSRDLDAATAQRDAALAEVARLQKQLLSVGPDCPLMYVEAQRDAYRAALADCTRYIDDVRGACDEDRDHPVHRTPDVIDGEAGR